MFYPRVFKTAATRAPFRGGGGCMCSIWPRFLNAAAAAQSPGCCFLHLPAGGVRVQKIADSDMRRPRLFRKLPVFTLRLASFKTNFAKIIVETYHRLYSNSYNSWGSYPPNSRIES